MIRFPALDLVPRPLDRREPPHHSQCQWAISNRHDKLKDYLRTALRHVIASAAKQSPISWIEIASSCAPRNDMMGLILLGALRNERSGWHGQTCLTVSSGGRDPSH